MDELRTAIRRFPDRLEREMAAVIQRAAEASAGRVSAVVPRRTGALASSVSAQEGSAVMGEGLAYSGWIEYGGTRGRPYVPGGRYVLPSALSVQDAFVSDATRQTESTIGSYPWPMAPL